MERTVQFLRSGNPKPSSQRAFSIDSRDITATTDAAASAGARKSVSAIRHRQIRTGTPPAARHRNFVSVRGAGRLGIGQLLTA
jgi:hypothetical protein